MDKRQELALRRQQVRIDRERYMERHPHVLCPCSPDDPTIPPVDWDASMARYLQSLDAHPSQGVQALASRVRED